MSEAAGWFPWRRTQSFTSCTGSQKQEEEIIREDFKVHKSGSKDPDFIVSVYFPFSTRKSEDPDVWGGWAIKEAVRSSVHSNKSLKSNNQTNLKGSERKVKSLETKKLQSASFQTSFTHSVSRKMLLLGRFKLNFNMKIWICSTWIINAYEYSVSSGCWAAFGPVFDWFLDWYWAVRIDFGHFWTGLELVTGGGFRTGWRLVLCCMLVILDVYWTGVFWLWDWCMNGFYTDFWSVSRLILCWFHAVFWTYIGMVSNGFRWVLELLVDWFLEWFWTSCRLWTVFGVVSGCFWT